MRRFSGSHFEVGAQIGAYYARHGVRFQSPADRSLLQRQLAYYEQAAPEILEEMRGVAAGGNFAFDNVAQLFGVMEMLYVGEVSGRSCSIGGLVDRQKQSWVLRNYDWYPLVKAHFQAWKFDFPEMGVAAISDMCISEPGDANKSEQRFIYHDAINSHGLYIGLTYAHCGTSGIGLSTGDMVKLVAWRCKTVAEALDLIANTKLSCPKNFFIADRAGKMAVVEHAVTDFAVRYPDADGIVILTNHYGEALKNHDLVAAASSTWERYSRLQKDLQALQGSGTEISFETLDEIMTNPATPVCQFLPDEAVETVWTLLMQPTRNRYRLIRDPRAAARVVTDFSLPPPS